MEVNKSQMNFKTVSQPDIDGQSMKQKAIESIKHKGKYYVFEREIGKGC